MKKKLTYCILFAAILFSCSSTKDESELQEISQFTLTVSVIGGGSISPDANGTYNAGSSITISAIPDVGYQFDRWVGTDNRNATCANATLPTSAGKCRAAITMNSNRNVKAYFKLREQ